jgi:hypothetical protein
MCEAPDIKLSVLFFKIKCAVRILLFFWYSKKLYSFIPLIRDLIRTTYVFILFKY